MDHRLQHFAGWLLAAGLTTVPAAKVLVVADSTRKQLPSDTLSAGARIYEYIAHPTLQLLTWPMETLVAPTVRTLTYTEITLTYQPTVEQFSSKPRVAPGVTHWDQGFQRCPLSLFL